MIIFPSSPSTSIAVLIADDHRLVRVALREILVRAGMWILAEASTPREVVEHARHPRAELVILDLSWRTLEGIAPREAGLAALLSIKTDRPSLPVLVYSADGRVESVQSCRRLGANGYLIKGVDDSRLVTAVRAVHAGERIWSSWRDAGVLPAGPRSGAFMVESTSPVGASPDSKDASRARTSAYVKNARSR